MVWHNEPIKIHGHPPMGTQVREYMALRGRCPSFAQVQILGGEVVSQSSPSEPQGAWLQLHLAIRDLNDTQLREAIGRIPAGNSKEGGNGTPTLVTIGPVVGPCRQS